MGQRQRYGFNEGVQGAGRCRVCGRNLRDPESVRRGIGPICWRRVSGGAFDDVLNADDATWEERERRLRAGGEYDLGAGWQMMIDAEHSSTARVSVRFNKETGLYEVYAAGIDLTARPVQTVHRVLYATADIRDAFRAAVQAGPELTAGVLRQRREAVQAWRRQARRGGRVA